MLTAMILGLAIGYVLAIPPGPITFAAIRMGFRSGWPAAVRLAIGAGAFDIVYCLMAMIATSAVATHIQYVIAAFPQTAMAVQLTITGAMVAFGAVQMRQPRVLRDDNSTDESTTSTKGWGATFRRHGPLAVGVGFALANIANPTFLPALAAMSAVVQQSGWYEASLGNAVAFSVAFGVGQASWLLTVVRMLLRHRARMTPTFVHRLQQAAGAILMLFGTGYAVRILTAAQ